MDLELDVAGVRELFETSLGTRVQEDDRSFFADLGDGAKARGPSVDEIQQLLSILYDSELDGEAALYTSENLEVLVREENSFAGPGWARRGAGPLQLQDSDGGLQYILGPPSDHFTIFLAHRIASLASNERYFWRRVPMRPILLYAQGDLLDPAREQAPYTLLDALRDAMPRMYTLRIESEKDLALRVLQELVSAFSFQLAYNLDTAFVPVSSIEEVIRRTRLRRIRRLRPDEMDPPRRIYDSDLVHHYQLAIATDSPPLEYLCYYHIAEHFFEAIFEDDLITGVRAMLTQPSFSFRRKQDVRRLVAHVKDRLKFQRDEMIFSEQEALELVLSKYVDMRNVREKLEAIQDKLLVYYAAKTVAFAKGD